MTGTEFLLPDLCGARRFFFFFDAAFGGVVVGGQERIFLPRKGRQGVRWCGGGNRGFRCSRENGRGFVL